MPKKILTVVGTRPNFIKITRFDTVFSSYGDRFIHRLVHTGQHYDFNMSDVFFQQLNIRKPDYFLNIEPGSPLYQMGAIMIALEKVLDEFRPDLVLVVGDVNSTFSAAFSAYKKGILLAHVESGLRSFDREMPEEINRLLTDEISDHFFITEQSGIDNLEKAGKKPEQLHFVGNTMIDTLVAFDNEIAKSAILKRLNLGNDPFALMTIHRPSNVDEPENLSLVCEIALRMAKNLKVVFPVHPRTMSKLKASGLFGMLETNRDIHLCEPLDYFSFQKLVAEAKLVLTDSGGVQEETTFRRVPCLTLRKNTERPSTVLLGTNELLDFDVDEVMQKVHDIVNGTYKTGTIPPLWDGKATERIVQVIDKIG